MKLSQATKERLKVILAKWLCSRNDCHETDRYLLREQCISFLSHMARLGIFDEIPETWTAGGNSDDYRHDLRITLAPIIENALHQYGLTEKLTLAIAERDFPAPIIEAFRDYGIFNK